MHDRRVRQSMCPRLVRLRRIGRDPELLNILVVPREEIRHRQPFLRLHVPIGHAHRLVRRHAGKSECTAHRWGAGVAVVVMPGIRSAFLPARGGQCALTVDACWGGCRRIQRREAVTHRGAFVGTQRGTVDFNSEAINGTLRSHIFVGLRYIAVFARRCFDFSTCSRVLFSILVCESTGWVPELMMKYMKIRKARRSICDDVVYDTHKENRAQGMWQK